MRHVPAQVVLMGCETAKTSAASWSDASGLGLAQALVLAGAEAVVAAREPVLDQAAASLSMRLYQASDADALDVRRQLGLAVRSLEADPHFGDLAFFRVVVR
jgi:CHAT domain-containing protein